MGRTTHIPPKSRQVVKDRSGLRCERCGSATRNGQWHHRRSRRVDRPHRHCPCNGVWLCGTCHEAVHGGKEGQAARAQGFVVSQWADDPRLIPVTTPWGIRFQYCDGTFSFVA